MVAIEILEGKGITIVPRNDRITLMVDNEKLETLANINLSKAQAETLAAVLLVMAKQLD